MWLLCTIQKFQGILSDISQNGVIRISKNPLFCKNNWQKYPESTFIGTWKLIKGLLQSGEFLLKKNGGSVRNSKFCGVLTVSTLFFPALQ